METGTLIKSINFHTFPYWVVKCSTPNLIGNIDGELPIDQPSFNFHPWAILEGRIVKFELVKLGDNKWYARLKLK